MQLVVLGSGTSVFHPQRASPAFWLQTEGGSLLLDCSADAPHRMARENLDWRNLDHCAGLAPFLFGIKWAPGIEQRRKPLKIAGCEGIKKLLKSIDDAHNYKLFDQKFEVQVEEVPPTATGKAFELLDGLQTEAISTPHRRESLALRITDQAGAILVYTADTGYSESVAALACDADLLIVECSFYRDKPTAKHLELADAMRIAQLAEPKRLMLTHLYPEWDKIDLEREAKKLWPGETIEARDGLRLEIKSDGR
jgi:ribonuclease BN (tRNA processing enzyme)